MAISYSFPLCNSTVPTAFTAWGYWDFTDVDPTKPAQVTFTPAGGAGVQFNMNPPRGDNYWTANVTGLLVGTTYTADAFYTRVGNPVPPKANAPQVTDIQVTGAQVPVPLPPPSNPSPGMQLGAAVAAVGGGAAVAAAALLPFRLPGGAQPNVAIRLGTYPFPTCPKVHRAVAVVRRYQNTPAGPVLPVPGSYVAVYPVQFSLGTWTALIPVPPDAAPAGPQYAADILFLDRDTRVVVPPVSVGVS